MDEKTIKSRLEEAMAEPAAPRELVERTVTRATAITAGREAEKTLAAGGPGDPVTLAAKSAVGRLMLTTQPPANTSAEKMAKELADDEKFRAFAAQKPEKVLNDLQSGRFLKNWQPEKAAKAEPRQIKAPQKIITKSGPSR